MIPNLSARRFLIHPEPVHLRKKFDGFLRLVETGGNSVVFFNGITETAAHPRYARHEALSYARRD